MNTADLLAVWNAVWPFITVAVAVASTLDATLPQPAPGSHWLVARKLVSFVAVNVGNASNGKQPDFLTWLIRVVTPALQAKGLIVEGPSRPSAVPVSEPDPGTRTFPPYATVDAPASPPIPITPAIPDAATGQPAPVPSSPVIHEASNG